MKKIIIAMALAFILITPNTTFAKDKPLPYTTPRAVQVKGVVQISWYNTTPKVYTIVQYYEKCTPNRCLSAFRVVWKKYVGIGNVRVNDKKSIKDGTYKVY